MGTALALAPALCNPLAWIPISLGLAACAAAITHRPHNQTPQSTGSSAANEDRTSSREWGQEHLANTVHELRTPLTTIMASLDMLHGGYATTPEDTESFLEQSIAASHHMMFLINDLLDWSAIDAGMLRVEDGICYPNDLLEDARRIIQPIATVRDIELVIEALEDDSPVRGDSTRILQVIFNLLGNALKFTPAKQQVGLRAIRESSGVRLEVWDNGEGIAPEDVDKIFEKFGQLEKLPGSRMASSGIGLYVSKKLVEQMGGEIGYRRRDGGGSIFFFHLKLGGKNVHKDQEDRPSTRELDRPRTRN